MAYFPLSVIVNRADAIKINYLRHVFKIGVIFNKLSCVFEVRDNASAYALEVVCPFRLAAIPGRNQHEPGGLGLDDEPHD
jgi:hypothetical protein